MFIPTINNTSCWSVNQGWWRQKIAGQGGSVDAEELCLYIVIAVVVFIKLVHYPSDIKVVSPVESPLHLGGSSKNEEVSSSLAVVNSLVIFSWATHVDNGVGRSAET